MIKSSLEKGSLYSGETSNWNICGKWIILSYQYISKEVPKKLSPNYLLLKKCIKLQPSKTYFKKYFQFLWTFWVCVTHSFSSMKYLVRISDWNCNVKVIRISRFMINAVLLGVIYYVLSGWGSCFEVCSIMPQGYL